MDQFVNKSSEITKILNTKTTKAIKWCTPSVDGIAAKVVDPYKSDVSISYEVLGYPSTPSGIFQDAYRKAARVYGSHYSLFSVNGSTGSNFIVLKALHKQIPNLRILAQRNIHKSVMYACEDYSINLIFLPPNLDEKLQIFIPNPIDEIMESIKKTKPQVLLITNPTYEGIVLDLGKLVKMVRKHYPEIIIFIDEAWGSHLHFSHRLPLSAMDAGADICVQSTHKQGGSLQQTGMIHWNNGRINTEILLESYRSLSTSSPSYTLLASLDAAREMMEKNGPQVTSYILDMAKQFTRELKTIKDINIVSTEQIKKRNKSIYARDETKIIIDLSQSKITGFDLAKILEEKYLIIAEKYSHESVLLLVPFRAVQSDIKKTVQAIKEILIKVNKDEEEKVSSSEHPIIPRKISKILELGDVSKLFWNQIEKTLLVKAEGRIAAETITPYPPGIPTTIKGEEFTKELIEYYIKLKNHPNSHILAQDSTLETVLVVK